MVNITSHFKTGLLAISQDMSDFSTSNTAHYELLSNVRYINRHHHI